MTKRRVILGAVMLAMMLAIAAPALAQDGGAFFSQGDEPPPRPPDYAFRDGTVVVGGDVVTDCRSFVQGFDGGYSTWGDQAQARRVLKRCEQAGMPTLRPPAGVRREIQQDALNETLPETGGVGLAFPTAGLLLLTSACLLALRGPSTSKGGRRRAARTDTQEHHEL